MVSHWSFPENSIHLDYNKVVLEHPLTEFFKRLDVHLEKVQLLYKEHKLINITY